jgi:nucleoside-diphosphate-sugar epimerase
MTILITGGTGFVGLAVAEQVLREGGAAILFARKPPPDNLLRRLPAGKLRIAVGDVRSAADLAAACRDDPIDEVIHLAAMTPGPERERADPQAILSVNVLGTAATLKAMADGPRPRRIVVMSSVAVYGFSSAAPAGAYGEDRTCPAPASLYGITKLAAEQTALRLGEVYGLDVRAIRLGPVFGPWEYATAVRDAMSPHRQVLEHAAAAIPVLLPRPMQADWIYSRDAARGILAVLRAPRLVHRVFNLGGAVVSDLVQWCTAVTAREPGLVWRVAAQGELPNVAYNLARDRAPLDNGRIVREVAFHPRYLLPAAADDYLAWRSSGDSK